MVSVIIVHYKVKKELVECINSIYKSHPKTKCEIIVIDNDEEKIIQKELKNKFPKVIYIPNDNKGFGQGNNVGAHAAKGEYLFFLNPDTKIFSHTIDSLVNHLLKKKKAGIAAPLLYDESNYLYPQGARELTPVSAVFSYSIIHTLFPNNPIAKKYWMKNEWDRKTIKEVEIIPGTAFMIRRSLFEKVKGFDEKFFLYFEEIDLCKRVRKLGWEIVMLPQSKVYHALGASTKKSKNIHDIFQKSRFYYLKKHFGLLNALWAESILRINKYTIMLTAILVLSFSVMVYKLSEHMQFIGDQGWFYISALDIVTQGIIPLVGITSSHPWLHQGAFWTYLLAPALLLGNFNPLSGAYVTIGMGLISIILMYIVGSLMFSQRVGILAALLFATSPLVIIQARMPYHTAPIPMFTLLYIIFLYKWIQGKPSYLPLIIFTLAVLYNFQIATFLLSIVFLLTAGYGLLKKKVWLMNSLTPKLLVLSIAAFLVPMTPMLLYDFGHGFPQTILFPAWIGYKIASVFGFVQQNPDVQGTDMKTVIAFMAENYKRLTYAADNLVSFTIALFSFGFLFNSISRRLFKKEADNGLYLLGVLVVVGIVGVVATSTVSGAYLPILFPTVVLVTALFFDNLLNRKPATKPVILLIVGLIVYMNIATLIQANYFVANRGSLADRTRITKEIVTKADGRRYNLVGKGDASQYESFTSNYEYLAWWLGNGPAKTKERLRFVIEETPNGIKVTKEEK